MAQPIRLSQLQSTRSDAMRSPSRGLLTTRTSLLARLRCFDRRVPISDVVLPWLRLNPWSTFGLHELPHARPPDDTQPPFWV